MKRTTIYLPDDLKARLETAARTDGRTEADVIREALTDALDSQTPPRPQLPLVAPTGRTSNWAEQVDGLLDEGFGRS